MAEENVPLSWYAILNAGNNIQPYLDAFELLQDPRLEPHDINGQQFGKLTSSDFAHYKDYEEVLNKTRALVALLTGTIPLTDVRNRTSRAGGGRRPRQAAPHCIAWRHPCHCAADRQRFLLLAFEP